MLQPTHSQKGSALIVSLVFLLLLSLVAVAGVSTSTSQERMAANAKLKNDSFQAAEAGLRFVAAAVRANTISLPASPCTAADCQIQAAAFDLEHIAAPGADWLAVPDSVAGNGSRVWYRIVRLGNSDFPVNLAASSPSTLYRLSVVSQRGNARTILEGTYAHTRF